MKVQKADGSVELRQAGEPVPEAATWANPGVWIKRGWIQADDHATSMESGYTRGKLKPMIPAGPAAIARSTSHVPVPGKPLPGVIPTVEQIMAAGYDARNAHVIFAREQALADGAGPNESEKAGQLAGEAWDVVAPSAAASPPLDEDQDTISELKKMLREDLEKLAAEHEIADPKSYPNKEELALAILAKVKPEPDAPSNEATPDASSDAPSNEATPDASSDALVIDESLLTELLALDRSELDGLATDQGIKNPEALEHKAVAEAILEAAG